MITNAVGASTIPARMPMTGFMGESASAGTLASNWPLIPLTRKNTAAPSANTKNTTEKNRRKLAPSVGTKNSAISNEPDSVTSSVIGRYFMNCPTKPGKKSMGANTISVVEVEAIMGQAMRLAASP